MTKEDLRRKVWHLLEHNAVQRFPGAHGRVPNFLGSERAAARLAELAVWKKARTIKMNSDAPQLAVRRQALLDGKVVYLAVPSLRTEKILCFAGVWRPENTCRKRADTQWPANVCREGMRGQSTILAAVPARWIAAYGVVPFQRNRITLARAPGDAAEVRRPDAVPYSSS